MNEAAVVLHEETAGPVVGTGTEGRGYLHYFFRQGHHMIIGRVPHEFSCAERAQILQLKHPVHKKRGVFLMKCRTSLAAAGSALTALMILAHDILTGAFP